jgi:type IV pilus secretin PilQ/predicted competence protein
MKRYLTLALAGIALVAPRALAEAPGEVTAVSVLPGPGRAHVIIDVRGSVSVQDFTLRHPARLVIDVIGARLRLPREAYDGVNRGGIQNIRYSQFRQDVVRIVLELDALRDYQLEYADDAVRVTFGADREFTAWSSTAPADMAPLPTPAAAEPRPARAALAQGQLQQPTVTASFDSAAIADVMSSFAEISGKTILLGKDVRGFVTAEVKNQPWDVAFRAILESQGLSAVEDDGIISVDSREVLAARDSLEPLRTKIIPVNYQNAGALAKSLEFVVSSRGKVTADTSTNSIIITDVEGRLQSDSLFVAQLDVPTPQVSIQAKLILVDRTDIEELGVRYDLGSPNQFFNQLVQRPDPSSAEPVDTDGDGVPDALVATEFFNENTNLVDLGGNALAAIANAEAIIVQPALQLIYSTAIGNFNLTTFVEALQRVELADLQAQPLITTADNTRAFILDGERTPIRVIDVSSPQAGGQNVPRATTEIVPTGIRLEVTPHVTNNRQVLLKLRAENSSIQVAPADLGFTFQTQEAENQVLVNDGETSVIGGLTVTQVTVAKSGIPFLVDLPIIGGLFGFSQRQETRRDLLVLVTPHIVDNPMTDSGQN